MVDLSAAWLETIPDATEVQRTLVVLAVDRVAASPVESSTCLSLLGLDGLAALVLPVRDRLRCAAGG